MKRRTVLEIDLQLFAEGAAGGGEGAPAGGEAAPEAGNADAMESEANVPEGKDLDAEFEGLIKGKYKAEFDKRMQRIAQSKQHKLQEARRAAEEAQGLVDLLGTRYGLEDAKAADVLQAVQKDDAYWQDAAAKAGMTVEQYRHMAELETQNRQYIARYDQEQKEAAARQQMDRWIQQADECRDRFPAFDFDTELQNPEFVQHLRNGVPVTKAFMYAHMDELMTGAMAMTAGRVKESTAAAVRSNIARPVEGVIGGGPAAALKVDIKNMSAEEFRKIQEEVEAGKRIVLG